MVHSILSTGLAPVIVLAVLCLQSSASLPASDALMAMAALCVALVLIGWALLGRHRPFAQCLLLAAVGGGAWCWAALIATQHLEQRLPPALEGIDLTLTGVIDDLPVATSHGQRFGFRVERCEPDCTADSRIQLSWNASRKAGADAAVPDVKPAQRWTFVVRLKRPHASHNPGAFDRELRWLQEGVGAIGSVRSAQLLDDHAGGLMESIERLRRLIRRAILEACSPARAREAGVLAALAMGDQAAIDASLWTVFNQTGVGHLMSISGLHITMLAGLGASLAGRLWGSRAAARRGLPCRIPVQRVRLIAAVAVAFAYSLIAGWGIPAQRTCFMLAAAALWLSAGRQASIASAVGVAAAAIVMLDPWAPLAAGFWLSFVAVLAIVWVCSASQPGLTGWRLFADGAVRTQWAATIALVPLGAWFFGSISIVGPLANAFAIPLVSAVITPLSLAGGAVALVSTSLASWLLIPSAWLTQWLLDALLVLAGWGGSSIALPRPGLAVLAMSLTACALLLAPRGVPRKWIGAIGLLPMLSMPLQRPALGEIWVTALDVGQGTSVVIQVGERSLVYDSGPSMGSHTDAGSRVVVPWLKGQGIASPDAMVISHLDDDHSGGARSILRDSPPDWVATSIRPDHPILAASRRTLPCRRGERWHWGEVEFEFLHPADPPEPARGSPTNAISCVLRIRSGQASVLLAGDIEAPQERRLLALYEPQALRADVLLVPHHGSATSSTEAFIDAVDPRWAVFQVAYRSRFNHPNPKVLARYEARGIGVLRSDADGAVSLRVSPDGTVRVDRSRETPARYWRVPALPAREGGGL